MPFLYVMDISGRRTQSFYYHNFQDGIDMHLGTNPGKTGKVIVVETRLNPLDRSHESKDAARRSLMQKFCDLCKVYNAHPEHREKILASKKDIRVMPFAQFLAMKDAIVQHNQCIFELRSLLPDLLHRNIYDPVWIEKQLRHHALQTQQKVTKVAKLEAKKLAKGQ